MSGEAKAMLLKIWHAEMKMILKIPCVHRINEKNTNFKNEIVYGTA